MRYFTAMITTIYDGFMRKEAALVRAPFSNGAAVILQED
jgi:hypothetical protein